MSKTAPRFEGDIKPLFREFDRKSMLSAFDLWSYDDVTTHAERILAAVSAGSMPCDEQWSSEQVELFKNWVEAGAPA